MKKILITLLLVPTMAQATFLSGNSLLSRMKSTSSIENMVALGYVMGVSDTYQNQTHCSGRNVTSGQTHDVVKQYLETNPSIRDNAADILVMIALSQAFPCKQQKDNKGNGKVL